MWKQDISFSVLSIIGKYMTLSEYENVWNYNSIIIKPFWVDINTENTSILLIQIND